MEQLQIDGMTITPAGDQREVRISLQSRTADREEKVNLTVLVPLELGQSVEDVQKASFHRAMEILRVALL